MHTDPDKITKLLGRINLLEEIWTSDLESLQNEFERLGRGEAPNVVFLGGKLSARFENWLELNSKLLRSYKDYAGELERLIPK